MMLSLVSCSKADGGMITEKQTDQCKASSLFSSNCQSVLTFAAALDVLAVGPGQHRH